MFIVDMIIKILTRIESKSNLDLMREREERRWGLNVVVLDILEAANLLKFYEKLTFFSQS